MSFSSPHKSTQTNSNTVTNTKTLSQQLSDLIFTLATIINKPDSEEVKHVSKEAVQLLQLVMNSEESQMVKRKLTNDLNTVLSKYKQLQLAKQQSINTASGINNAVQYDEYPNQDVGETTPLLKVDRDLEARIEINESIIQERELELVGLETSIAEVNEIFRDLSALVNDQQYLLGTDT